MMDITDKESYRSLYSELKQYEKRGIDILMDGYGRLESLTFTDVDELNVDKFGLSVLTP